MSNIQNQKDKEFLRSVKEQLYIETFEKDVPDYSPEKVETLVKMLELEEGGDEKELEEAQKAFEERFQKAAKEEEKKHVHTRRRRVARAAAAMLVIVMLADITSEAVMDESIFHVLSLWKNQMAILPGDGSEVEIADFQEADTRLFTTVEEFAEEFGEDFLVCMWLPEGVEFKEIILTNRDDTKCYMWNYGSRNVNYVVSIRMYQKIERDIAGLTGTQIEGEETIDFDNGITATVCSMKDNESSAAFEYDGWWYMIYLEADKEVIKSIVGGMERYE